jgi:outer membrane protein OmpA-like peptidoglycan-associated protein
LGVTASAADPAIDNELSVPQIIDRLTPTEDQAIAAPSPTEADRPTTRRLGIGTGAAEPAQRPSGLMQPTATQTPSVNFQIRFKFGSADLTPEAREVLDRIGEALQSDQLARFRFQIAGHTDAVGSDAYNQRLSEQRAAAVLDYLMQRYGDRIDPSRLESVGYGEERLLDPANPNSAVNRRVQVINLGSG